MTLLLVRHGETEWSRDGRHTSTTDLPLTDEGVRQAEALGARLRSWLPEDAAAVTVLVSPRRRARATAELAGLPPARVDDDLVEWDYGDYEGLTTPQIRESVPGWTVWTHPCPGGESDAEVAARVDRVIAQVREHERAHPLDRTPAAATVLVAHAHLLRALTARWLELPVGEGRLFRLETARVCALGYERDQPVIRAWNA